MLREADIQENPVKSGILQITFKPPTPHQKKDLLFWVKIKGKICSKFRLSEKWCERSELALRKFQYMYIIVRPLNRKLKILLLKIFKMIIFWLLKSSCFIRQLHHKCLVGGPPIFQQQIWTKPKMYFTTHHIHFLLVLGIRLRKNMVLEQMGFISCPNVVIFFLVQMRFLIFLYYTAQIMT